MANFIYRQVELRSAPDMFCLLETFRELADGRAVTYIAEELPVGDGHSFAYLISSTYYQWSFLIRPDQSVQVIHSVTDGDAKAGKMELLRASMLETEARLSNRCGMPQTMSGAREDCVPRACPV